MKKDLLIALLLILISLVWAGSFVVVKLITEEIDPIHLGFLRFLVALPLMILLLLLRNKRLVLPKKEIPSLIILGLTGVTLLYVFQFVGITYTTASTSAVLINTNVIFIALLSVFFLHEKLTKKRLGGIVLSFIGVVIVMFSKISLEELHFTNIFFLGSILMLLSALCWAVYTLVGKRLLQTYDEFVITTYALGFGTLFYIPLVLSGIGNVFVALSFQTWLAVVYLAIVCTVFAYLGWYYALKHIDASKAAVFLNLIPFFTIVMSVALGEALSWFFLLGAILIIYGVYLAQKN